MKRAKKSTVVAQLNMDVIGEILSRLPVIDLIRFKSVCKSWFQLISSKDFIELHLQRSTSLMPISFGKNPSFGIDCHRVRTRHPETSNFCGSSCDGLVCLFNTNQYIIHIWNPALRSSTCILMRKKCSPDIIFTCFWFGLHNDNYKLVLGTEELEIHVLRPYIDSCFYNWKSEQKLTDGYCPCDEIGTLFNGNVHWPVLKHHPSANNLDETGVDWKILSYNLHDEKVGEIGLPVERHKDVRLGEVCGCLSAAFVCPEIIDVEIWSMKEYGLKESWTKMAVLYAKSYTTFQDICPVKDVVTYPKSPFYLYGGKEVYNESLVSPKLLTQRSLRSHKKKSCRIIEEVGKDT